MQSLPLREKQGRRRVGGDGQLQRTVSTKQPSDCLIRDRKRLLPRSPSATTFQKQKKSQQRRDGPRLAGHLVGKPSSRQLSRSAKQPPASLRTPDLNTAVARCEGGRGHKQVKALLCFLASLLIGSGLHRMKLARKLLTGRALLVLAANCWVCFQVWPQGGSRAKRSRTERISQEPTLHSFQTTSS